MGNVQEPSVETSNLKSSNTFAKRIKFLELRRPRPLHESSHAPYLSTIRSLLQIVLGTWSRVLASKGTRNRPRGKLLDRITKAEAPSLHTIELLAEAFGEQLLILVVLADSRRHYMGRLSLNPSPFHRCKNYLSCMVAY